MKKEGSNKKRLFGTNGVRGVVNKEITPQLVLKLGHSIGTFLGGKKFLLAYDGRLSNIMLSDAMASGLIGVGCEVYDAGMMPTPALQYLTRKWKMDSGVMITASHNPPEYNGVKVIDGDGIEIPREKEKEIEEIFFKDAYLLSEWDKLGNRVPKPGGLDEYKASIKIQVDEDLIRHAKLKVVIDPANGVGGLVTPYLLHELGCEVCTINSNIDGKFPGRPPEPTLENISQLCEVVKACNADLGIAHDGDADRTIFVDEKGIAHWGDKSFAIIEDYYLSKNPGKSVVTPVSSSKTIEEIAVKHGSKIIWTKVGSINVSRKMQDTKAPLGGEENGGVFYGPHQPVRDGAMVAALMIEIIAHEKVGFSKLVKKLPLYFSAKDKIPCPENLKEKALEHLLNKSKNQKNETLDGLKIWISDKSWVLIRPSGTEPIYRIFAEASKEKDAHNLVREYKTIISGIIEKLR